MELTLEAMEALILGMKPEDRAELETTLKPMLAEVWLPQPGKQIDAYYSKADELLYGGAAGGGKTDLIAGLALTAHKRSLVFRRQSTDLDGLWARLEEIGRPVIATNNNVKKRMVTTTKRIIEGGHLDAPGAEKTWQGRPHDLICVQRGTSVIMGDGARKPVEDVAVGDMVATLEGPRRVNRTFAPRTKEGGRLTVHRPDGSTVSQVQSANHAVLHGRNVSLHPSSTLLSTPNRAAHTGSAPSSAIHRLAVQLHAVLSSGLRQLRAVCAAYPGAGSTALWGSAAYAVRPAQGTSYAVTDGALRVVLPRPLLNVLAALPLLAPLWDASVHKTPRYASACGVSGAPRTSSLEGSTDRYSYGTHPGDAHTPVYWGPCAAEGGDLLCLRLPDGAGLPSPSDCIGGVPGQTHARTRRTGMYAHPYTKETRQATCGTHYQRYSWEPLGVVDDLFDMEVDEVNHYITESGIVNKNCFDEGAQLDEMKVSFVTQWLRSEEEGQRCRVVIATNPPIPEFKDGKLVDFGAGLWLKEWFAPWLDTAFPQPAEDGELRHCYMVSDGERLKTMWVDAPGTYHLESGDYVDTLDNFHLHNQKTHVASRSRSFIRSKLKDNVYLAKDGAYAARLSSTPEPLRSLLMDGDFSIKLQDNPWQVIPTNWVLEAQQRWRELDMSGRLRSLRQLVLCADIAQGGSDATTLAALLEENAFDEVLRYPGSETPDGPSVAIRLLNYRRHNSLIALDGGGGWSGDTKRTLQRDNNIEAFLFQPGTSDGSWNSALNLKYLNLRASAWWHFRDALNPQSGMNIALPPNKRLETQLTSVLWHTRDKMIIVESKDDIRKRIGSSTDEADAVIMAWHYREHALQRLLKAIDTIGTRNRRGDVVIPKDNPYSLEHAAPMKDPLGDW